MFVQFTCKSGRKELGAPEPADACHCPHPIFVAHSDTCLTCGRYDEITISRTWRAQARMNQHATLPEQIREMAA
jgi:hypothetical protein